LKGPKNLMSRPTSPDGKNYDGAEARGCHKRKREKTTAPSRSRRRSPVTQVRGVNTFRFKAKVPQRNECPLIGKSENRDGGERA